MNLWPIQKCKYQDRCIESVEKGMKNTVRFSSMLLYGIADAKELKSKHFTDEETRAFLLKNNLKEALQLQGEWRWKD